MTNEKDPLKSKIGFKRESSPGSEEQTKSRGRIFIIISALALTLGVVLAANSISIPRIEFGAGVADVPTCTQNSVVNFDLQVQTTGTTIRALDITGLSADCNNQYLRVSLTSSTDSVLRQMTSSRLTTATTLRLVPATPALDPDLVRGINLELSDQPF